MNIYQYNFFLSLILNHKNEQVRIIINYSNLFIFMILVSCSFLEQFLKIDIGDTMPLFLFEFKNHIQSTTLFLINENVSVSIFNIKIFFGYPYYFI
jgi:hypothetical protein